MKYLVTLFRQLPFFFAIRHVVNKIIKRLLGINSKEYYSQTGEDIIIKSLIQKDKGFFVDVGCNHPTSFSNTFELYKRGWIGLNIDANPEFQKV